MEEWTNVLNAALIGTDKASITINDLPDSLHSYAQSIFDNTQADKEEKFLQLSILLYSYRKCGSIPVQNQFTMIEVAEPETKEYRNLNSAQILKEAISEECNPLIELWLKNCKEHNQLVSPDLIPTLLDLGIQQEKLRRYIIECCGSRGKWLSKLNQEWSYYNETSADELWLTGSLQQRRKILLKIALEDPNKARDYLAQTWMQEDAPTRQTFLEVISVSPAAAYIPFLVSLETDKSKKIREKAMSLLKCIPGSPIVELYTAALLKTVSIKKEKTMLGFSSKSTIHVQIAEDLDAAIFKTGIEKLSSNKAINDELYIIIQMMESVPPETWEHYFNATPESIIGIFNGCNTGRKLVPALGTATATFKSKRWAMAFFSFPDFFIDGIVDLLPPKERDEYCLHFFTEHPERIIEIACSMEEEWSLALATCIIQHTAGHPFHFHRVFYASNICRIRASVEEGLQKILATDEYAQNAWNKNREYLLKLLQLKKNIVQSFKS